MSKANYQHIKTLNEFDCLQLAFTGLLDEVFHYGQWADLRKIDGEECYIYLLTPIDPVGYKDLVANRKDIRSVFETGKIRVLAHKKVGLEEIPFDDSFWECLPDNGVFLTDTQSEEEDAV